MLQTYFISDGARVKIGKSSNPAFRLSSFQVGHPEQLVILLILEGDHERALHKKFHRSRIRGEWFWLSKTIEKYIAERNPRYKQSRSFVAFVVQQFERTDEIGWAAREMMKDPYYPRNASKLSFLLNYFENLARPDAHTLRRAIKHMHREWRNHLQQKESRVLVQATSRLVKEPQGGAA